eukprot:scaffold129450_cov33-Tisochrysis_lutea.AAC.2
MSGRRCDVACIAWTLTVNTAAPQHEGLLAGRLEDAANGAEPGRLVARSAHVLPWGSLIVRAIWLEMHGCVEVVCGRREVVCLGRQ